MSNEGEKLIGQCKEHVLATMSSLPGCAPNGSGLRSKYIEKEAGLALNLPEQDGWLTWSILMSLVSDGKAQVRRTGKRGIRHFRLGHTT
jgi:hypothetical protein